MPDSTFGQNGIITTAIGSTAQINDIALQNNGMIVAVGLWNNKFALARYTTSGALDNTFGTDGIVTTTIGTTAIAILLLYNQMDRYWWPEIDSGCGSCAI